MILMFYEEFINLRNVFQKRAVISIDAGTLGWGQSSSVACVDSSYGVPNTVIISLYNQVKLITLLKQ